MTRLILSLGKLYDKMTRKNVAIQICRQQLIEIFTKRFFSLLYIYIYNYVYIVLVTFITYSLLKKYTFTQYFKYICLNDNIVKLGFWTDYVPILYEYYRYL